MFWRYIVWAVLWSILILIACIAPVPDVHADPRLGIDKIFHAGVYAVFFFLLVFGFQRQKRYPALRSHGVWSAFIIAAAYGAGIELLQGPLPYRSMDILDLCANVFGSILGWVAYLIFQSIQSRKIRES